MIAERITNVLKLNHPELKLRLDVEAAERDRERRINFRAILVGVGVALLLKADMFSILAHLDEPWKTLGWVRLDGAQWVQSPATASIGRVLYVVGGCIVTGIGLGFGSKFWHDVLGTMNEVKGIARKARSRTTAPGGPNG